MLAIAALVGLIVSLSLLFIVQRAAAVATERVLVAKQDIAAGDAITHEMIELVEWPAHLKDFSALSQIDAAVGRITRTPIVAGEPILPSKLWREGESGTLEDRLTVGERALSVRVNEMIGVDADSLIGKHIDLIVTRRQGDTSSLTLPVAERLRVLAVNRSSDARRPQPVQTLTLGVTVDQAKAIETARADGTLTALLRSARDLATVTPHSPLPALALEPLKLAAQPRTPSADIELIRGAEKVTP